MDSLHLHLESTLDPGLACRDQQAPAKGNGSLQIIQLLGEQRLLLHAP